MAVLDTAARHGDPQLAVESMKILTSRSTILAIHHYEALVEAHIRSLDIYNAFRTITVMSQAGIEPAGSSTRAIFEFLAHKAKHPAQWSLRVLRQMHHDGCVVHISAFNVVLELFYFERSYTQMFEVYKDWLSQDIIKPNIDTFNLLLRGLRFMGHDIKDNCTFIVAELQRHAVEPDSITYDRLILACITVKDIDLALAYLDEMVEAGQIWNWWPRRATMIVLSQACADFRHEKCWTIFEEHCRRTKELNSGLRDDLQRRWKLAAKT